MTRSSKHNTTSNDDSSEHEAKLDELNAKMDSRYKSLESKFFSLEKHFAELRKEMSILAKKKDEEVNALKTELNSMKKKLTMLSEKAEDDLDSREHENKIIISGKDVPDTSESENCTDIVVQLLKDTLNYSIPPGDIVNSHRVGRKPVHPKRDNRSIAVKLRRSDLKKDIFKTCKEQEVKFFYINESLTPKRRTIMYVLRKLKREYSTKISGCKSINGNVYAWVKTTNPQQTTGSSYRVSINTLSELDEFCNKYTDKNLSEFYTPRPNA